MQIPEGYLAKVLCFNCVRQGGLAFRMEHSVLALPPRVPGYRHFRVRRVPVLSCDLCDYVAHGYIDLNGDAVFPDPHVQPDKLVKRSNQALS